MPKIVWILFGGLFSLGTAWCAGRIVLKRLRLPLAAEESALMALPAGAAVYGLLLQALGYLRLYYTWSLLLAGAGVALWAWRSGALESSQERLPALERPWRFLFWTGYAVLGAVCVIHALAPEMSPDGSGYHLAEVARWWRERRLAKIDYNMYGALSQGLELLFLNAWAFGRHSAAALVHCGFLLAVPLLMLRFGQRSGQAAAGAAAGLLVLGAPVAMVDGSSAYNDMAVALTLLGLFYVLELARDKAEVGWGVLAGLLGGFAYALKYTAAVGLVYAVGRLLWGRKWKQAAACAAIAAVLILPWVARNSIWYGNPFAPLLNQYWPNTLVHVGFEQNYTEQMRHFGGVEGYRLLPLELTIRGEALGGYLGPLFLMAPLALLSIRTAAGRRLLLAAGVFLLPYAANIGTRFLLPALPLVALAMVMGLPGNTGRVLAPLLALCSVVLGFPGVARHYGARGWEIQRVLLRQALRLESEESWLKYKFVDYRVPRLIERSTPPGAKVFSMKAMPSSYTTREIWVAYECARCEVLEDMVHAAMFADFQPTAGLEFRFQRSAVKAIRVVQTGVPSKGQGDRDYWGIAEMRLFDGGRELERGDDWRLDSRPNPWDIGRAFDGSPATRWRSWQRIEKGMWVEAAFGRPRAVDKVLLESANDQPYAAFRVDGLGTDGAWRTLAEQPVRIPLAPPFGLRREAVEQMKRNGIHFIAARNGDYEWDDFREKAGLWGISVAGESDGVVVWRLD
jgi:hypothetical protein